MNELQAWYAKTAPKLDKANRSRLQRWIASRSLNKKIESGKKLSREEKAKRKYLFNIWVYAGK